MVASICLGASCLLPAARAEVHGNLLFRLQIGEECDDGNIRIYDGCSDLCLVEVEDTGSGECGDGAAQPQLGEECDDGNIVDGDGCSSLCVSEYCGDDMLQPSREECDDGIDNSWSPDHCRPDCRLPRCGDGVVDRQTERCDDGNTTGGDGCGPRCGSRIPKTCGDANRDGLLSSSDALRILRRAVQRHGVRCNMLVCDLNGDARVTAIDAGLALRYAAGLRDDLFCAL